MASPEPGFSRRSFSAYAELNLTFHEAASIRNDATTRATEIVSAMTAHFRPVGLAIATAAMLTARTPHPHNQSAAAEIGESELKRPSGNFQRTKYADPITTANSTHAIETLAQTLRLLKISAPAAVSRRMNSDPRIQPQPHPAMIQKMNCSHGALLHHVFEL